MLENFEFLSGRRANEGKCPPLVMSMHELMDWLYFVLVENKSEKDKQALDVLLEPQIIDDQVSQEERQAAILGMGGGIK